MITNRKSF